MYNKVIISDNGVDTEVSMYVLARVIKADDLAELIDSFLNGFGSEESGYEIGKKLRFTHRTLQRLVILFALDILRGISEQESWDARNEFAIQAAKKVTQMREDGELSIGRYI